MHVSHTGRLEISRSRLRHNLDLMRARVAPAKLCATLKANAYGHGYMEMLRLMQEMGVEWISVYALEEGRVPSISPFKLLVLAPVVIPPAVESDLAYALRFFHEEPPRLNVTDAETARRLSASAVKWDKAKRLSIHMQVDTGLTRAGVSPAEAEALGREIHNLPGLRLEGVFAHLSHGDVPGHPTLSRQREGLLRVAAALKRDVPDLMVHLQNSGGAFHAEGGFDLVRVGIAMYGLQPSTTDPIAGLLPVAQLRGPVLTMRECPAGTGVGYGHSFITSRVSRLAVVPVGYADGYPRQVSNTPHAMAQVHGRTVPVVGRVSMDQVIVDVTDVPGVKANDPVTLISNDPALPNSLDRMADAIGTIGYELATHFGNRVERVVVD